MKKSSFRYFDNIVKIKVSGKNIDNYIKRIIKRNINIIKLIPISYKEVDIVLRYDEYLKLIKYKTIYNIKIINKYGRLKIKEILKKNLILFICLFFSISLIIVLSKMIFSIDVIHSSSEIKKLISSELKKYNIKKYTFKKSYNEIEKIEEEILENNKDKLEWIEIEEVGTKYIIRLEERILNNKKEDDYYQDIIATKSGVITEIDALSGEKKVGINSYAKKGDVIISGEITLPSGEVVLTHASGKVYAEVWYTVEVEYPFIYHEEVLTGNKRQVYVINFINKRISLFNFNKYNSFNSTKDIIFYNSLIPISFTKEKQYEVNIIDEVYTEDEIIIKAKDLAKEKLLNQNNKIKEIKNITVLTTSSNNSKMKIKLFVSLIEEIGEIRQIIKEEDNLLK